MRIVSSGKKHAIEFGNLELENVCISLRRQESKVFCLFIYFLFSVLSFKSMSQFSNTQFTFYKRDPSFVLELGVFRSHNQRDEVSGVTMHKVIHQGVCLNGILVQNVDQLSSCQNKGFERECGTSKKRFLWRVMDRTMKLTYISKRKTYRD